ncbi:hypothetical protein AAAC51_06590 [Priestia megaterium]
MAKNIYTMQRSFCAKQNIPTEDLLEAVNIAMNYEADLFINNVCVMSVLGLPMEENIKTLARRGIETYVADNCYRFRYADPSKNVTRIYYDFIIVEGDRAELHLSKMPSRLKHKAFSTKEEIYNDIRKNHPSIRHLLVVDFSGEKYTGSYEYELYGKEKVL